MISLPATLPSTMPSARIPWILAATLDSESVISCTWAACAVTAMTLPTSPCPTERRPPARVAPTTAWSTRTPSADPLSICTHACHWVGDLPITRATTNSVPFGKVPSSRKSSRLFEPLVLLRLLFELTTSPCRRWSSLGQSLARPCGRPAGPGPPVAVLEGLRPLGRPRTAAGRGAAARLLDGVHGPGFRLPEGDREQSQRSDDQDDEDEPSPDYLVTRHHDLRY